MFNHVEKRTRAKPKAAAENGPKSSSEAAALGGIATRGRVVSAATTGTPPRPAVGVALAPAGRLDSRGSDLAAKPWAPAPGLVKLEPLTAP